MVGEDWRSEERYADVQACSAAALAWEFLRRNPDYTEDFARDGQDASSGQTDADGVRLARWGLSFRRRSEPRRGPPGNLLAARSLRPHGHPSASAKARP